MRRVAKEARPERVSMASHARFEQVEAGGLVDRADGHAECHGTRGRGKGGEGATVSNLKWNPYGTCTWCKEDISFT